MPPTRPTEAGEPLSDEQAMRLAMEQAGAARAAGEVPVGAVLVRDGRVLATGANAPIALCDPSAHAEILALRTAALALGNYRLEGCTLYVTLEPCAMCAGAMLHARLARVVFGAADPRTGAAGSVLDLFAQARLNHRTEVSGGVLAAECAAQLRGFFKERRGAQARAAEPLREDALRTPPAAFGDPALQAWEGAYCSDLPSLGGLRLHFMEIGAGTPVFICLHAPADWGQRFASLARGLEEQGARVLVPDLVGFGRSDKPKREDFHHIDWHVRVLLEWFDALGLDLAVLVADTNDPMLAFALAGALGERSAGVLLLPTEARDETMATAPYPDRGHQAGLRAFAGGWPPAPRPSRVLLLDEGTPKHLARAVEYFRA